MKEYIVQEPQLSNDPNDKWTLTAARGVDEMDIKKYNLTVKTDISGRPVLETNTRGNMASDAIFAETIIEQLINGTMTYARISLEQKFKLFEYLYKYNPYIARVIDLHTLLPLSSFRIQKPEHSSNSISRDYVYNFYERMLDDSDFMGEALKMVRYYWLYGKADLLIMDDYWFKKDTTIDETDIPALAKKDLQIKEKDSGKIQKIIEKYEGDPEEVKWNDREKVLKAYGLDYNTGYGGISKIHVLHYKEIKSIERNDEIGYSIYELYRNTYIDKALEKFKKDSGYSEMSLYNVDEDKRQRQKDLEEKFIRKMASVGYTEGFVRMMMKTQNQETYKVDTDPYNQDGMYIATFNRKINEADDSSAINRILESAIDYTVSRRRDREKANMSYKQNRLFCIKDGGPSQVQALRDQVQTASASKEGYDVYTNLDVQYSDLSLDVKDRMDFSELKSNSQQDIMVGMGMTDSLLAGGETYSGSFLKVELLTTEYKAFRNEFSRFVENVIFKPCSVKRAFVTKDEWGNNTVVVPTVRFDKMSIARGTEDFNLIVNLVQSKILPVKAILNQLGYDYEETQNELRAESTSIFSANNDGAISMALQTIGQSLATDKNFLQRVAETNKLSGGFAKNTKKVNEMMQQAQMGMMPPPEQGGEMGGQPMEQGGYDEMPPEEMYQPNQQVINSSEEVDKVEAIRVALKSGKLKRQDIRTAIDKGLIKLTKKELETVGRML